MGQGFGAPWLGLGALARCSGGVALHLDSSDAAHHDDCVRTTVTLDEDVEQLLRQTMHRSRRGFKETLNAALRAGLRRGAPEAARAPFAVKARPMGLRAGIDPAGLNQLADELELDGFLARAPRPAKR